VGAHVLTAVLIVGGLGLLAAAVLLLRLDIGAAAFLAFAATGFILSYLE
jgi:hypothetical protein